MNPLHAVQASWRGAATAMPSRPRLLVAGATGVLGNEVLRQLVGSGRFVHTEVLASEAMTTGLTAVGIAEVDAGPVHAWPVRPLAAQVGLVMFEPPRLYNDRERSLWTPQPSQLPALAAWMRRSGVHTLVVVMPHVSGRLPQALKAGLASLDEHAVSALGFERVLLVRSARKADAARPGGWLPRIAAWMLSTLQYMIPANEQPVRPARVAEFIAAVLHRLPPGTHVVPPEWLWRAAQAPSEGQRAAPPAAETLQSVARAWLASRGAATDTR